LIVEGILVDEYEQGILVEARVRYRNTNQVETLKLLFDQDRDRVAFR
jgi:hypothetical protein